jgi:hypothetical protein
MEKAPMEMTAAAAAAGVAAVAVLDKAVLYSV